MEDLQDLELNVERILVLKYQISMMVPFSIVFFALYLFLLIMIIYLFIYLLF